MHLTLEIQSPNELQLILQYIRLLQTVKVLNGPKNPHPSPEPQERLENGFMQYCGILQTGLTLDEIDEKISQTRQHEWERAI